MSPWWTLCELQMGEALLLVCVVRAAASLCGPASCCSAWLSFCACRTLEVFSWRWSAWPEPSPTSGRDKVKAAGMTGGR